MNNTLFLKKFESKSDEELKQIIDDKKTFSEQARIAAISILKERNVHIGFTEKAEAEIKVIQEKRADKEKTNFVTDDPNAPELHSKNTIYFFASFFSTIFGAVLMLQNFREVGNNKVKNQVLMFGILYTLFSILLIITLNIKGNFMMVMNFGGAGILINFFWNKYLGKKIKYRKRSWIKPAIISVIIIIPFLIAFIFGE